MSSFIVRPSGATDLQDALIYSEETLPQVLEGIPAGSWQVGRISWAPEPVEVTAPEAFAPLDVHSVDAYDGGSLVEFSSLPPTTASIAADTGGGFAEASPLRVEDFADALWDARPPHLNTSTPSAAVTTIADATGNGRDAVNGNAHTYQTDGTRHWVQSGTDAYFEIPLDIVRNITGVTFFAALRRGSSTIEPFRIMAGSTGTTWLTLRMSSGGTFQMRGRRVWSDSQLITDFGSHSSGVDYTVIAQLDFTTGVQRAWVDGELLLDDSFHSGGATEDQNSSQAGLFEGTGGRFYAGGIVHRVVTDAEARTINDFLLSRSGKLP